jgi:hypothetical protein
MRALFFAIVLPLGVFPLGLSACAADIASGSYLCGPEQACPGGQACNGPDNVCVFASTVQPFACLPNEEHEPDNTPDQGLDIGSLDCVSAVFAQDGCLAAGDPNDWYRFTAPTGCTSLEADIRINYPLAFEPLAVVLADASGQALANDGPCAHPSGTAGDDERCITAPIPQGQSYAVQVKPAGGGDCDGHCNYNRYALTLQLGSTE